MAVMAWGTDQHCFYLAFLAWVKTQRILGNGAKSKLHLAPAGHRCVFYCRVGARMEMALSARADQKDPNKDHVPDHDHWIHGQQYLPGARRRSVARGHFEA